MKLEIQQLRLSEIIILKKSCNKFLDNMMKNFKGEFYFGDYTEEDISHAKRNQLKYVKQKREENKSKFLIKGKSFLSKATLVHKNSFIDYLRNFDEFYFDEKFFDKTFYEINEQKKESNSLIKELYKKKKDKGVYIFYHRVPLKDGSEGIIPLYVGKSVTFLTRFNQYQNIKLDTWYSKYFNATITDVIWEFDVYFSLIVINDPEKIKQEERKVIYDLKPMFNIC